MAIVSSDDVDQFDIEKLKKLHVNAVALHLVVRSIAEFKNMSPEAAWNDSLSWADRMLDACRKYGITGIITFYQVPIDPSLGIRQDSPEFWDNPEKLNEAVQLAGRLAQHFKSRGNELAAYDFLTEPLVVRQGVSERPTQWPQLRSRIIKEIRKYDPDRYIVVTPGPGGESSGYRDFRPLPFKHIIYGAHVYYPHSFTHQGMGSYKPGPVYPGNIGKAGLEGYVQPLIDFKKKFHVPIYIGEFSAANWAPGASQYLYDLIYIFNKNEFSWVYYSYNGYPGWEPSYDELPNASGQYDEWQQHYVGDGTKRWALLRKAYLGNIH